MSNFGERLAYWYLRLNGFLLVENFVLHRQDGAQTSDADLLGVRLSHSVERIDGQVLEPDRLLARELDAFQRHCALLVQVKTGGQVDPGGSFSQERLHNCFSFIGCLNAAELEVALRQLENAPLAECRGWTLGKLLVSPVAQPGAFLHCTLEHAIQFIRQRLAQHAGRKAADRMFFPDELMQFFAWEAGLIQD